MKELQYRMYVFVERHLSPIDKGIQASHAVIELYNEAKLWNKTKESIIFDKWAHFDKTLILLDGGNVNDLNNLSEYLSENGIHYGAFAEEDLDNILTAVAVVVDERIFNKKDYPDFETWLNEIKGVTFDDGYCYLYDKSNHEVIEQQDFYNEWVEYIGGEKNLRLRELINNKKLAR